MSKPIALCLMGPTASGKTDLAVELVQQLPCDIISVDSALVYRRMDIGTAKPDAELQAKAPHRLIDIIDPHESYSAAEFCADATREMNSIVAAGRIPLLVGGTMLYYKSLLEGMAVLPSADPVIRAAIEQQLVEKGSDALHQQLQQIDPDAAARIHPNDPQRITRALEVWQISGKTLSQFHREQQATIPAFNFVKLCVAPEDRALLHQRIEQRFHIMLEQGFQHEVEQLKEDPRLTAAHPSIRCVGYRQMWDYLDDKLDYDEMVFRGVVATRQLAKRQFTWLRSTEVDHWYHTETLESRAVVDELASTYSLA